MSDGFYWLTPRNVLGVASALRQAQTMSEREQLKRLLLRGMAEWTFIIAFFVALIMGFIVMEDTAGTLVANIPG